MSEGSSLCAQFPQIAQGAIWLGPRRYLHALLLIPWYVYLLALASLLSAAIVDSLVKRHDRKWFERRNRRLYLEFTTKVRQKLTSAYCITPPSQHLLHVFPPPATSLLPHLPPASSSHLPPASSCLLPPVPSSLFPPNPISLLAFLPLILTPLPFFPHISPALCPSLDLLALTTLQLPLPRS